MSAYRDAQMRKDRNIREMARLETEHRRTIADLEAEIRKDEAILAELERRESAASNEEGK